MKFKITRTPDLYPLPGDPPPCDGAEFEECIDVDIRAVNHPQRIGMWQHLTEDAAMKVWLSEGENHRLINGKIARNIKSYAWVVDIDSLEDLLLFMEGQEVIVKPATPGGDGMPEIEIYDSYMK